ncbi:MAG: glycosyltransferase [Helicobacteraceae bacterium]|nr:glycosyltransferase [Helicobacteraceae bacterium]
MKKKLAILIYSLGAGGAEKVVTTLLPALIEKFDVTLVLMNETISYDLKGFNNIHFLENSVATENGFLKLLKLPFLAYKYKQFANKNCIDLSLSLLVRPNLIAILSKLMGSKSTIIVSEHSLVSQQYSYKNLQSKINKFLIKIFYNHSDRIVAVSNGVAKDLTNNFHIKNQITTIYNPIELDEIDRKKVEEVDFNFDKFTFITIGRLDDGKNHKLMISAFSKLTDRNTQLLIIGEGDLRAPLEKLSVDLGVEHRVFLIGQVSNPYKYLHRANCFLLTSKYESFGMVLVEALACDLPIISTECESGPIEILKTKEFTYAILVENYSQELFTKAMQTLLSDRSLLELYKKSAKVRSHDFAKKIAIKQYVKLLDEVS